MFSCLSVFSGLPYLPAKLAINSESVNILAKKFTLKSVYKGYELRKEDSNACTNGAEDTEKNSSGSNIFGTSDKRSEVGRDMIGKRFDGRVHSFKSEDKTDRQREDTPLHSRHSEENAGDNHGDGNGEMDPRVVFNAKEIADSSKRIDERASPGFP